MRHRIALPQSLGASFGLAQAEAAGIGRWRRDTPDLDRPFRGIRATKKPDSFRDVVSCYQSRLKPRQRFVGTTAVRLWGMPHPTRWQTSEPLEIAVPPECTPPKTRGVRGRRLAQYRARTWSIGKVPVVDPLAAVFTCAADLTVDQAVILLDAVITRASHYPGLLKDRPTVTLRDIEEALARWGPFPGHRTIRDAAVLARSGVESPKETETRLTLVHAGLPEPCIQYEVCADGYFIARLDLAYPELKIAIEYEGDGHRTDKVQWRKDIRRQRDLEDLGWVVIRLTQDDLGAGADAVVARIRRAIAERSR